MNQKLRDALTNQISWRLEFENFSTLKISLQNLPLSRRDQHTIRRQIKKVVVKRLRAG